MYHCYFLINYMCPPKVFFLSFGPPSLKSLPITGLYYLGLCKYTDFAERRNRQRTHISEQLLQASACNTDTTPTQPHRNSNTHRTKNNTVNVVIQQISRKLLMMGILTFILRTFNSDFVLNSRSFSATAL